MCYILGTFSSGKEIDCSSIYRLAENVLLLRGRDAVGAYCLLSNGEEVSRRAFLPKENTKAALSDFLKDLPRLAKCVMLQTRAIPEPEMVGHEKKGLRLLDTQPFERVGWVVSHNGTCANDRELRGEMAGIDWESETTVDSVVLPYLFSRVGILKTLRGKFEGSFAIAALDAYRGRFWLGSNFQPLFYDFRDGVLYYSSLPTRLASKEVSAYTLSEFSGYSGVSFDLYREPLGKSVIVVHSSGMDSTISLRLFQVFGYKVAALHFKYGQQAETAEEYCSKKICEILGVPWYCLRYPTEGFESPLLEKTKPPLDALWDSESTFSYVHQRNLIMSSMAFALAEQLGYGGISLGFNESDSSGYPDNGVPFVRKLNELTPYSSNWQVRLHVYAPFVNLMKSELLEVGLKIGVPFEYVCSCYYPKLSKEGFPIYCGDCGCDTLYRYAWTKLGYRPPNLGFEKLDLPLPQLIKVNPSLRLNLEEIPYGYVIEETL